MNKNLKKTIAIALIIGTVSVVESVTKINLLTTMAYASTDSNDIAELNSLKVETPNGSGIKLYYDDSYENYNKVDSDDVKSGHTYYAKTSSSTIKLEPSGPDLKYIRVFKGTSSSTKGEEINNNISLSTGINTITVRVYKEEPDKYLEYEDEAKVQSSYIINIDYNPDGNGDSDDNGIYLKSLTVDNNDIKLSESQTSYNYSVSGDVEAVSIEAEPEEDDYKVTIDGDDVDESNSFKKSVVLENGENDIKIEIEDSDDDYKEYTLKINKGKVTTPQTSTPVNTISQTVKINQWVQINVGWQYNDSTGNPMKNTWFFDKNYERWYYLGADGLMSENCWILSGGKYYYLNADGTMAVNTTISGYKVGADGAWIGK
jgi:glucan-binding YG repeat protein